MSISFALSLFLLTTLPQETPAGCFAEAFRARELPPALEWARDVRWVAEEELILLSPAGVFSAKGPRLESALIVAGGKGRNELFLPWSLGASQGQLMVAGAAFSYARIDPGQRTLSELYPFATPQDFDIFGDQMVILGTRQEENGDIAVDGVIAHRGKIGQTEEELEPVFFSEDGPGAESFMKCVLLEIQNIRFLKDGSLMLVPGVEGGAYLYDPAGKLVRSFTAAEVGFESGCRMAAENLARDEPGRWAWVNERKVVDDIVPLPDGAAGLILRELHGGKPQWHLKILRKDGSIRSCPLDIPTSDPLARIKADSFGDQIGLLVSRRGYLPFKVWRIIKETGERVGYPIKLHPDEPALWLTARYRP